MTHESILKELAMLVKAKFTEPYFDNNVRKAVDLNIMELWTKLQKLKT